MPADEETARSIAEGAEGWITGIRLAALSSRHRGGKGLAPTRLKGGVSYITDYLLTEVLEGQSPAIQDYLLRTSILDHFCAPLCEAVCLGLAEAAPDAAREGETRCELSGRAYLEWLETSDLFVTPLDDRREWYRYHHLFQQLLYNQLQRQSRPNEIAILHSRASAWFARQGLIDEALYHALEAGDDLGAARLVEQHGIALLNENKWYILEKWLAMLPADLIQQRPLLLIAQAWIAYFHTALQDIPPLIETLESLLAEDETARFLQAQVDFFWGHHWYWQGQIARSLERLEQALERIPASHYLARGEAWVFWSLIAQMSGRKEEVVQKLHRMRYEGGQLLPFVLGSLLFIHVLSGELPPAAQIAPQGQDLAVRMGNRYTETWYLYIQGYFAYFWNDLEQAARYFALAVEKRYALYSRAALDVLAGLALTRQALGQEDSAGAAMDLLLDFARESGDPGALSVAHSCQARLALLRGDLAAAFYRPQLLNSPMGDRVMFIWIEIPQITHCRVLIAQGSAASLQEAGEKLAKYRQLNEAQHNTRQLLDILVLQALVYRKQGRGRHPGRLGVHALAHDAPVAGSAARDAADHPTAAFPAKPRRTPPL